MGMASFTSETSQIKTEFEHLKNTFNTLKKIQPEVEIISMGMSGDYQLAIGCVAPWAVIFLAQEIIPK